MQSLCSADRWQRLLLITSLSALSSPLVKVAVAVPSPPNVIVILADDMAPGDLSAFNGGRSRTPYLDQMISEGIWFHAGYSAAPVCAPARAALLTGRYPHRTGVVTLNLNKYPQLTRLRPEEVTIADVFAANGYVTGIVGKWHTGAGKEFHPLKRGFQEAEVFSGSDNIGYYKYRLSIQGKRQETQGKYLTDDLSERALAFVRRHAREAFFLHLAHYAPHRPLEAPPDAVRRYRERGFNEKTAVIYAMVEIMDQGIGRLLDELERLGIREKTLVVFASDNGPDPLTGERFNLNLRGTKYQVYEGGIHVPLVFSWLGTLPPGERSAVAHFTDLFPTLVEICQLQVSQKLKLDGVSLAPALWGTTDRMDVDRFWQWNRALPNYTHNAAMRQGPWKLVRPYVTRKDNPPDSTAPAVLYHLQRDPLESTDLSGQHPQRYERMKKALQAWSDDVERDRVRETE